MPTVNHSDGTIIYKVIHQDVAFIKIYIDDLNGIVVTASPQKEAAKVHAFVEKKADWIFERWQATHDDLYGIDHLSPSKQEKITYLGRSYRLKVEKADAPSFAFQQGTFRFSFPSDWTEEETAEVLRKEAARWLYNKAREKFPTLSEGTVKVEEDNCRLGFKEAEAIQLNWRLIQRPKAKLKETLEHLHLEYTF